MVERTAPIPADLSPILLRTKVRRWRAAERLLSLPPDRQILRCGDIGWLHPQPTLEWYKEFYGNCYGSHHDQMLVGERLTPRRLSYFDARLARITRHLGRKPQNLLDVGAGEGLFLVAAHRAGIPAMGIEISAEACRDATARHGVRMIPGHLLQPDLPLKGGYDVVVMNHVFEHLLSPLEHLARVRALLSANGLLVIEIPQQFLNPIDLLYQLARYRRPFSPYSLHHPIFYTVSSILRVLKHADFRVEHLTTWLTGQVYLTQNPWVVGPLQCLLWFADRLAKRGHIIEVFATKK